MSAAEASRKATCGWAGAQRVPAAAAAALVVLFMAGGCQRASSPAEKPSAEGKEPATSQSGEVLLKPEEIAKAGIQTSPVAASKHAPESVGYALVLTRETIAQAIAEVSTAAAVERQSNSALLRGRHLAGTPGALPVESQEATERQAAVDQAALMLAERRLSSTYGQSAPWKNNYNSPALASLASGATKLARVSFPLGALAITPGTLRFVHIGEFEGAKSFESTTVWSAPADSSLPGKSYFAVLKGSDASEGERLLAHAATGEAEPGVVIPFSAVVISGGRYWCYVEERPGVFTRTPIDTSMPTDEGYFVKGPVTAGANVVVSSAGELLAHETNPGTAAD
ncbi:MAG: hypothetical protein JOZ89_06230 [Gammaproteobacteria bacterium]|nr:hypothetical protein [Gammaproteobacteria bacterium]